MFLAIEGLDGSGKSTLVEHLQSYYIKQNKEVVVVREPGGTVMGEALRDILKNPNSEQLTKDTEILLFISSRLHLIEHVIRPALARGAVVIADRFYLSTITYQGVGLDRLPFVLNLLADTITVHPDWHIWIDVEAETALRRRKQATGLDRIESRSLDYFKTIRAGFNMLFHSPDMLVDFNSQLPKLNIHRIDADTLTLGEIKDCAIRFLNQIEKI
jgi:dTMP kinase